MNDQQKTKQELIDELQELRRQVSKLGAIEEALRESEERYRTIADFTHDWEYWIDPNNKLLYVSPSCERITGYSAHEFLDDARLIERIVHPDDLDDVMNHLRVSREVAHETTYSIDFRIIHREGQVRWINHVCRTVYGKGGQLLGRRSSNRDITDRKQAEQALRASEEKYRVIFERSPVGLMRFDANGIVTECNEAFLTLLAARREQVIGFNLLTGITNQSVGKAVESALSGEAGYFEGEYTSVSGGRKAWATVIFAPLVNVEGNVIGGIGIAQDFTKRKEAEEERDLILNMSSDLICIAGMDGYFKYLNPAWERVLGYTREYLLSRPFLEFIHPDDHHKNDEEVRKLASGRPTADFENRYMHRDGSTRIINWTATALPDKEIMYCIGRDVTDRRRAEEALEQRVIALTRPLDVAEGIAFEDLFDLEEIQKLQDQFAKAVGVASLITRVDGTPITKPSNFCRLCEEIIRKTEKGLINCRHSDSMMGMYNPDGPTVQPCLSAGLSNAGASISVGGRHIANWMIGQVRNEKQNSDAMRVYARTIGADEEEFIEACNEVPFMSQQQFAGVAQALYTLAGQLSTVAYQNVQQARFIAERKAAEEALRESEARYRRLFEDAVLGIFRSTPQGTYDEVNPALSRMFGYDSPEEMKSEITDIRNQQYVRPEDRDLIQSILAREGVVKGFEEEARRKDGELIWISINVTPVYDRSGTLVFYEGTAEDITLRKRMENKLRDSEKRYRRLHETMRDAFVQVDMEGRITDVNAAYERMLGYSRDEFLRLTYLDLTPAKWHEFEAGIVSNEIIPLGQSRVYEKEYIRKDGTTLPVELRTFLMSDDSGQPTGMWAIVRDITERKRAEDSLRQSEALLKEAQRVAHIGHWELDSPSGTPRWSEEIFHIFGLDPGRGEPSFALHQNLIHPEDWELVHGSVIRVTTEGIPFDIEFRCIRPDESIRWINAKGYPTGKREGEFFGMFGTAQDVTERKEALEALQMSEQRFRVLAEAAPFGMVSIREDGTFQYINPRFRELFGYSLRDVRNGREWFRRAFPDAEYRHTVISKWIDDATRAKTSQPRPRIFTVRCKDGTEKAVNFISVSLPSGENMVTCEDITEKLRAEELAVQTERLQAIGDLAGGVAHNFNNLLQVVVGGIDVALIDLEMGNVSEPKKILKQVLQSSKFGAEMVTRLQTFAQVRADAEPSKGKVFDLSDMVRQAAEMTKPIWQTGPEKEGISISLSLTLLDGCWVLARESEMLNVLVNLVKNAAEALPRGGEIGIKTSVQEDEVVLHVMDNGVGITSDNLKRVFQPFWSTKGVSVGTGMGLAVSHGIITRHGGTISVESQEGKGTIFTIRLPLAQAPTEAPVLSTEEIFPEKLKVLVIDDMVPIIMLVERILMKHEQTVFSATVGEDAVEIFRNNQIDLVICDLGMPGMNGWEVGKAIRVICQERGIPKTPFILLTGWGGQALEKEKIVESGVDAVVEKPLEAKTLMAAIKDVTQRTQTHAPKR